MGGMGSSGTWPRCWHSWRTARLLSSLRGSRASARRRCCGRRPSGRGPRRPWCWPRTRWRRRPSSGSPRWPIFWLRWWTSYCQLCPSRSAMLLRSSSCSRNRASVLLIGGQWVRPPCRACGWRRRGGRSCLLSMIFNGWMLPPLGCSTSRCAAWAGCRWALWRASVPGTGSPPGDRAAGVRLDLGGPLPGGRCARHVLGPLSLGALQQVLKRELGPASFPHWTWSHRWIGGNRPLPWSWPAVSLRTFRARRT